MEKRFMTFIVAPNVDAAMNCAFARNLKPFQWINVKDSTEAQTATKGDLLVLYGDNSKKRYLHHVVNAFKKKDVRVIHH